MSRLQTPSEARARLGAWATIERTLLDRVLLATDARAAELDTAAHEVGRAVRTGAITVPDASKTLGALFSAALTRGLGSERAADLICAAFIRGVNILERVGS